MHKITGPSAPSPASRAVSKTEGHKGLSTTRLISKRLKMRELDKNDRMTEISRAHYQHDKRESGFRSRLVTSDCTHLRLRPITAYTFFDLQSPWFERLQVGGRSDFSLGFNRHDGSPSQRPIYRIVEYIHHLHLLHHPLPLPLPRPLPLPLPPPLPPLVFRFHTGSQPKAASPIRTKLTMP